MTKRIVLHETQGPHSGLWHICGTDDEFDDPTAPPPDFVDVVEIRGRESSCGLVTVKPRYILYREVMAAGSELHPDQQ